MIRNKIPSGGLILAGLAAYAYYKYSKMSEEEKRKLADNLKEQGKKFYDQYVPENIKNMFTKTNNMGANSRFGEGSDFTS